MEPLAAIARVRRGRRIPHNLLVMLHWREPQGMWREVPAKTKVLSQHGCLLGCAARIKLSDEVMVWWLEKMRCAQARVVFRKISPGEEPVEIALEFLDSNNFWGFNFDPCAPPL